jgi:cytoskeleton protein RodZ
MSGRHRRGPAQQRRGRHRRPQSRQRLIVPALAATVVLAGSGTALGFAVDSPGAGVATPQISPFAAPAVLSTAPIIDPTPSVASPAPSTVKQHTGGRTHKATRAHPRPTDTLSINVTGSESWVEVTTWNNHVLIRTILHHGQREVYRQHGLQVVLGNAGAVRLSVAGRPAHLAGRPGEVRRFRIN